MTHDSTDVLIGFDVRFVANGLPVPLRDPATAVRHLPRTDLRRFVSFDRTLCPQRFMHRERLDAGQVLPPRGIAVEGNENIGFDLFYLWDDLFAMVAHHAPDETKDVALAYAVVNLEKFGIPLPADRMYEVLVSTEANPRAVGDDWPLLGFDIVNLYFQSFLGSFDLSTAVSQTDRATLATATNDLGLLERREDCADIVALANRTAADHGPFFALATHLLWDRSCDLLPAIAPAAVSASP